MDIVDKFLLLQGASGMHTSGGFSGITLGVVIDTDDPLQMGRLRVFCPALNDDPKQLQYVPWSVYASPFGGSINSASYTRGVGDVKAESSGPLHYGFWAVPELGAHVLVTCIDGDYRRRVWLACVPHHQETNTLHSGRWKWQSEGVVEGPLTSSDNPMEPLYTNAKTAFDDNKGSPEWKTRIADYQSTAIRDDANQTPNSKKRTYVDQTNEAMRDAEPSEWVHDAIGAHGYDWSGFKNIGAMLSSRTYGFSSPGMHMFVMDDRAFNSRMRFRTTAGHQILLDDTNERIYIATNKGKNWIEFDSAGNIDMYSNSRISISGDADVNISAGKTIRMFAGESINMYAGHTNLLEDGELVVTDPPVEGTITLQSENDLVLIAQNLRSRTEENTFIEAGLNYFANIGDSSTTTVTRDHSLSTVNGDVILSSGNCVYATSKSTMKYYSESDVSIGSLGDAEMQSFSGKTSISSASTLRVKSADGSVDIEASANSGNGQVGIFAPNSQHVVGSDGIHSVSTKDIATVSANEVASAVQPGFSLDNKNPLATILAGADINISKISTKDIFVNAKLGDLLHKTAKRGHSYDVLGDQIDELTKSVNILTIETGTIFSAVQSAIGLLGGSVSVPFVIDIGCALEQLFSLLPQELLDAFATFQELQAELQALGRAVDDLFSLIDALSDQSILDQLGLPSLNISGLVQASSCTEKMPLFSATVNYNVPALNKAEKLRGLINDIYDSGAKIGEVPILTDIDWSKNYV